MQLRVLDEISAPGGTANEDRKGFFGTSAWVIDGATDVIDAPLTTAASDAAWFAAAMTEEIDAWARLRQVPLSELPYTLAPRLEARLRQAATRLPQSPDEQPSAAAMIVDVSEAGLSYVTLGDCALMLDMGPDQFLHIGDDEEKAGDQWVAKAIEEERANLEPETALSLRRSLWPRLRKARRAMNDPHGYGIFSITPPPPHFVRFGNIPVTPGTRGLICSDGLMRLVDVMRRYAAKELFEAAFARGLASLVDELRALEIADATCLTYPRAKQFDDTTAIMFEIV